MNERSLLRNLITPWVVGGAATIAIILMCATVSLVWLTRPDAKVVGPATAVMQVITAPTSTPVAATPTATIPVETDAALPPAPLPGTFGVGAYVQISGTGGDGLRLRSAPGLDAPVRFLALESEVFRVQDGPREADGYTWWYLVAPYEESIQGWAVSNYLAVVQQP